MEYTIEPRVPNVRPQDPPDYDGIVFVYCFTNVLAPWTQPAANSNVTLAVANSQGFLPGMTVVIENGGYYEVVSTTALDRMTVMNFGGGYNQPPGTPIAPGKITTTSLPGPPGTTGPSGPQGAAGATGPQGNPGPPLAVKGTVPSSPSLPTVGNSNGDLWIATDTGHGWAWSGAGWIDVGPVRGPTGPAGAQGPAGPQGVQGATGPTGNTGNQGPTGPAGSTGPQGPQGIQGNTGVAGPQGAPGGASAFTNLTQAFTMPAVLGTGTANVTPGSTVQFSLGGVVYTTTLGYLGITAINAGANQLTLQNLGYSVNLPQGTVAPIGAILTGTGTQGPPGPTGNPGSTGSPGTAATVNAGTTTTLPSGQNALVTNVGSSSAAIFNFSIPAGPAGSAGNTGPQGPAGATGAQGATGSTGPTGAQGATGPAGTAGVNAFTTTNADFTVPASGSTVIATLTNASWVVVGQMLWVDTAGGGAGQAAVMYVAAKSGNQVTLQSL